MFSKVLCVAAGGAIGAVLRYLISILPFEGTFPVQTFITNILGALAIGFITTLAVVYARENNVHFSENRNLRWIYDIFNIFPRNGDAL